MPAHIRIRILLLFAVAVICGSVFTVSELQRRADATSFEQYALVRELRGAGTNMALVLGQASSEGATASNKVETAERRLLRALDRVRMGAHSLGQHGPLAQHAGAVTGLARLAETGRGSTASTRPAARVDELLERFIATSDALLAHLAAKRAKARANAARRPVIIVLALSLLFGFAHLLFVERPARKERGSRSEQAEFAEAMQVARAEAEAYSVLSRHVARAAAAHHVTVLNRNNSADRLEAATPAEPASATARALEGAAPDSCLAIRLARTHRVAPGDEPLVTCEVCGMSAGQTTCVPSLVGGEVVGAVLIEHRRALGPARQRIVEQSVAEAAPVIANLRNLAVAEVRAATDGLTGLPNQRAVHDAVKRASALAGRTATPLALVLFDLDHFKVINDTYGHGKGDEVLAAVGLIAAATLRASDFVVRLGGEEFAAALPATDRAGGLRAAEKLRAAIATIKVPGVNRPITASFGVAMLPDDAGEPELLLREADRALYSAKNAGRNRVETVADATAPQAVELIA